MSFRVRLQIAARLDIERLGDFLSEWSDSLAERAVATLYDAVNSLQTMPDRGRPLTGPLRELVVPFGKGAYIVRYVVSEHEVLITRIFHSLEDRPLA
ncbi:type II toxin-antitoxin system RelE/ParE family toxin [Caulobacter mirabilis]|uniref:Plasmid stabilization protein n=1 Tax=Caulobacter mirabilis TaxID=69666 RepID=A0A2D2AYE4_9CAUL|nr:type II toxin-antitoxin system RelE/ParE family toxin [Caulobacter mirabilis]ATQ43028.1 plasmid stabilization protein [Caulobacter mirabilis]